MGLENDAPPVKAKTPINWPGWLGLLLTLLNFTVAGAMYFTSTGIDVSHLKSQLLELKNKFSDAERESVNHKIAINQLEGRLQGLDSRFPEINQALERTGEFRALAQTAQNHARDAENSARAAETATNNIVNDIDQQRRILSATKTDIDRISDRIRGIEDETGSIAKSSKDQIMNLNTNLSDLESRFKKIAQESQRSKQVMENIPATTPPRPETNVHISDSDITVTIVYDSSTRTLADAIRNEMKIRFSAAIIPVDQWESAARIRAGMAGRQRLSRKPARAIFIGKSAITRSDDYQRILKPLIGRELPKENVDYGKWPIIDVQQNDVLIMLLYEG